MKNKNALTYIFSAVPILLLAYGLRLLDTAYRSLWFDEAVEYLTASVPLTTLPEMVVRLNYQPPLVSFLLHMWLQISIHPLWLRYLMLIFSMFAVVGMMMLTLVVVGRRASLVAGIITAVMPTEIYYAQDVGEYALLVLCIVWSLFFLYLAYENGRWRDWILWGVFSIFAMYTQYGAALLVIPLALFTLIYHTWFRRWTAVIRQLIIMVGMIISAVPLLVYFLPQQIHRVSSTAFTNSFNGIYQESLLYIKGLGDVFVFNLIGWPFSPITKWWGIGLLILISILSILLFPRSRKRPFLWLSAVYSFYFIIIRFGLYTPFGSRQGLFFTPFLVLIVAIIFEQLWQHKMRVSAILFIGLILFVEIYSAPHATLSQLLRNSPNWSPSEELAPAINYWQENRQSEQTTFVYYSAVPAFRYYLQVNGLDMQAKNRASDSECSLERQLPVCEEYNLFYSPWIRSLSGQEKAAYILDMMGQPPEQFWLVFSHVGPQEKSETLTYLQEQYEISDQYINEGVSVYLLNRN